MRKSAKTVSRLLMGLIFMAALAVFSGGSTANAQGYIWILDDMKVSLDSPSYPEFYAYSYEGQKDGKEWIKYAYHWSFAEEYGTADLFFGCDVPPASIPAGEKVTLEMNYQVVNFAGRKKDGPPSVPTGDCLLYVAGRKGKDANGVDYFWPGNPEGGIYHPSFLTGDLNASRSFSAYAPDSATVGKQMEIVFQTPVGHITWTYTLANR